MTNIKTGTKM